MSANPPNQITVDPSDPEQALALLNHIARTFQADASTHDAIRQAVETLKGSLADQATWKTIAEWGTAPEVLALIQKGLRADGPVLDSGADNLTGQVDTSGAWAARAAESENGPSRGEAETDSRTVKPETSSVDRHDPPPDGGSGNPGQSEPLIGICATHPEKRLHALERSCETWVPANSR